MSESLVEMSDNWKVYVSTFNCAKKFPFDNEEDIFAILRELLPESLDHDIYALGFQELISTWEASFPSIVSSFLDDLSNAVLTFANGKSPTKKFQLIGKTITGAVGLVTLVDDGIKIEKVTTSSYRCGLLNSSLKGSSSICCSVRKPEEDQETFTFICSHLNANEGVKNAELRVNNYESIMGACATDFRMTPFKESHIFFFGDLNFRVHGWQDMETDYSNTEVLNSLLKNHDELNKFREKNLAFQGFDESPISFPPTYKYQVSTPSTFNDKRTSSWCDRILFRRYSPKSFKIWSYRSIERTPQLQFTDHQAVVLDVEVPSHFTAEPLEVSPSILSSQQLFFSDLADITIGYVGWGLAKKVHYWVALFLGLVILYKLV